eukprot:449483-Rhodomonas_salina.6
MGAAEEKKKRGRERERKHNVRLLAHREHERELLTWRRSPLTLKGRPMPMSSFVMLSSVVWRRKEARRRGREESASEIAPDILPREER